MLRMGFILLGSIAVTACATAASTSDRSEEERELIAFVTSERFTGDLLGHAPQPVADGAAAADALCEQAAREGALSGTYAAWISSSEVAAADRITAVGPWHILDGTTVFGSHQELAQRPKEHIDLDQHGRVIDIDIDRHQMPPHAHAWTGTRLGGEPSPFNCSDWTTAEHGWKMPRAGMAGSLQADDDWSAKVYRPCDDRYRLLCLEVTPRID